MNFEARKRILPLHEPVISPLEESDALQVDREQERKLTAIAEKMLNDIKLVAQSIRAQILDPNIDILKKVRIFAEEMKKFWPNNDGHRTKPRFELESASIESSNIKIRFEPLSEEGGFERIPGEVGGEIAIGIKALITASTEEAFDQGIETLASMVYHEVEHIVFPARNPDEFGEGAERTIGYLAEKGEIRAHAKQFAYKYTRRFPGELFNLEKMRSISASAKEVNYFIAMTDPAKQEKYRTIANLGEIHRQIVRMTEQLVAILNEN